MKIPEEIWDKALDGGYEDISENDNDAERLLDPKFFQALGKALGWNEISGSYHSYNEDGKTAWQMKMHRFIDHLIAGKSVESFFEELNIK